MKSPLKAWTYPDEVMKESGFGVDHSMRLPGSEAVRAPDLADVIVIPSTLQNFKGRNDLLRLPHFERLEARHVAFDCSDNEPVFHTSAILIRCNTRTWMLQCDPNTISWPWPVEPAAPHVPLEPAGGFKFDVGFQGWEWSPARKAAVASCRSAFGEAFDVSTYSDFFGYLKDGEPEQIRRRGEFLRSLRECRVQLCPQSIPGVFPYRFWEAISAGRVPVLVSTSYVLPFIGEIPYHDFCVFESALEASCVGARIMDFLKHTPDSELIEMGRRARVAYEQWLHRDKWPDLMTYAVEKKARTLGLIRGVR